MSPSYPLPSTYNQLITSWLVQAEALGAADEKSFSSSQLGASDGSVGHPWLTIDQPLAINNHQPPLAIHGWQINQPLADSPTVGNASTNLLSTINQPLPPS